MLIVLNFVPTFIAVRKDHKNKLAIFLVNLFLGWTLLGWVVALVWAIKNSESPSIIHHNSTSAADELKKLHELKESGVITEAEFDDKKAKLLGS
ncbi:superinfection immunity protein [Pseudoalteromonas piscicida]|uniref:superinfection immunity protein n=1 Tax=Pseudoalteromonas piscicida TaxID=43662 RepID=UPI001EFCC236|nr:superinfection immunity protein [Pseudoalteromonas piscicida]